MILPILSEEKKTDLYQGWLKTSEATKTLINKVAGEAQKEDLRRFVEWGEEACERQHPPYYLKKRGCSKCWQELRAELVELEKGNA